MLGLALFTTASLACALASSDAVLIASRAAQGLGGAIMLPAALSIVMNTFEEGAERNKALGIWGGLGAAAGTTGLIAGGILTKYVGWTSIFFVNVPIGVVALALAPRIVPDSRLDTAGRRFDALGAIVGTGGLVLLVDAISQAPQYGWGATRTIALLAGSVAVVLAFLAIKSRVKDPLLPLSIFRVGRGLADQAGACRRLPAARHPCRTKNRDRDRDDADRHRNHRAIQAPVNGHFLANLAGPFALAGAGTAFSFIPISVAALTAKPSTNLDLPRACLTPPRRSAARSERRSPQASRRAAPMPCFAPVMLCPRRGPVAFTRLSGCWERSRSSPLRRCSCSYVGRASRRP
jgi:MFS family permease